MNRSPTPSPFTRLPRPSPGGPTKIIDLFECKCKKKPKMNPADCPADCPDIDRYKNIVPTNQVTCFGNKHWKLLGTQANLLRLKRANQVSTCRAAVAEIEACAERNGWCGEGFRV
jgi:hypothetical protein